LIAINGHIQRKGDVVHLVAQQLFDPSSDLSGLAYRDTEFKLTAGRADEFAHGSVGGDTRDRVPPSAPCDIFIRHLHIDTLKIKARNLQ